MLSESVLSQLHLKIQNISAVHGGDINDAYCVEADEGLYFIKLNSLSKYPNLFKKEANGLKALALTNTIKTPTVLATDNTENTQYLLLEWIPQGSPTINTWNYFGEQLAALHKIPQPYFGFNEDNYLGTYLQHNTPTKNWTDFYSNYRITPMIQLLYEQNKIGNDIVKNAENFGKQLNGIFPAEPPSLLHGDLWSGNYITDKNANPLLIDPATYYGHREVDLGMTRLFSRFAPEFYKRYNDFYPLEKNWEQRLPYSQLYPLLFHAYAFGGHYVQSIKNILKPF